MSERSVHAVVLKRRDAGESDRRLTLFTHELGKIDAVAKGARKAASRLAGSSDPLTASVMTLAFGKRNEFITQVQPQSSFRGLRTDYDRLTYGLALAELYEAVLPYEQPLPDAYHMLLVSLTSLEAHGKPEVAMVWSEVRLMEVSGFLPSFDSCAVSGEAIKEAEPYLSPDAGGYVCEQEAYAFTDRYRTRAEVLYGLSKIAELDQPPPNLKMAKESLIALLPFWRKIAGMALPANESRIGDLRAEGRSDQY